MRTDFKGGWLARYDVPGGQTNLQVCRGGGGKIPVGEGARRNEKKQKPARVLKTGKD